MNTCTLDFGIYLARNSRKSIDVCSFIRVVIKHVVSSSSILRPLIVQKSTRKKGVFWDYGSILSENCACVFYVGKGGHAWLTYQFEKTTHVLSPIAMPYFFISDYNVRLKNNGRYVTSIMDVGKS